MEIIYQNNLGIKLSSKDNIFFKSHQLNRIIPNTYLELCWEPLLREEHNDGKILKLAENGVVLVKHAGLQPQELIRKQSWTRRFLLLERMIRTLIFGMEVKSHIRRNSSSCRGHWPGSTYPGITTYQTSENLPGQAFLWLNTTLKQPIANPVARKRATTFLSD
uniref:Uncharacterized protein n=1 Tax=Salix viminalis TaxID=40686 RepID=A0A6N2MSF1_SALVM